MRNNDEPDGPQEPVVSERDERLLKYLVVLIARATQQQASPPREGVLAGT